jgi:hypothetical protein
MNHDQPSNNNPSASCCERCPNDLISRFMSWFTEETICSRCHNTEVRFKMAFDRQHQKMGKNASLFEGCGFLPTEFKEYIELQKTAA